MSASEFVDFSQVRLLCASGTLFTENTGGALPAQRLTINILKEDTREDWNHILSSAVSAFLQLALIQLGKTQLAVKL